VKLSLPSAIVSFTVVIAIGRLATPAPNASTTLLLAP
jgi:hypothetical protein